MATHAAPLVLDCVAFFAGLLIGALNGEPKVGVAGGHLGSGIGRSRFTPFLHSLSCRNNRMSFWESTTLPCRAFGRSGA